MWKIVWLVTQSSQTRKEGTRDKALKRFPWEASIYLLSFARFLARSPKQRVAPLRGRVTEPPLMRDRPPHQGLRPLLFTNSVWVL